MESRHRSRRERTASDGLPARATSGEWTKEKLTYLRKYAHAFMTAMAPKRNQGKWDRLVYVDLLAGPGIDIDDRGNEFPGSPLIALAVKPAFDRLFFGDAKARNVEALRRRIEETDRPRVVCLRGDCNALVKDVVAEITRRTLGFAFVDPEGFEAKFSMLRVLASRRVDVLYLFPSGIGINRNLASFATQPRSIMDEFWGDPTWRQLPRAKRAIGELTSYEQQQLDRDWVASFRKRVASLGLSYYDESDPIIRNDQKAPMYHLLFFSHDSAGLKIWRGIKRIEPGGQRGLPFGSRALPQRPR